MTTTENPAIGKDIVANGIRTNYLEAGSGGDTVVLIHGSGPGVTAYANWRGVLPALGEHFHVYAPDMVGVGYSDRPEGIRYGLDVWADQTLGFMDAMGIQKANLVGNSFGGGIALRIATQHPDRVGKLVLMGFFAYDTSLTSGDLAQARYEGATQPGCQESFSSMFPAPRQRWVEAMTVPEKE